MTFALNAFRLSHCLRPLLNPCAVLGSSLQRQFHLSDVDLRARKGTRERREKLKKKTKVVEKVELSYVARQKLYKKKKRGDVDLHATDDDKDPITADVYRMTQHPQQCLSMTEIVNRFRENLHPTIQNKPNAAIYAKIELNMQGEKKTKIKENILRIALVPFPFKVETNRTTLVFCKNQQLSNDCIEAGATHAGGLDLIKSIQEGEFKLEEYDYVLAHPDALPEMLPIRGLLKKKFPNLLTNTVDEDIVGLVNKFRSGVLVSSYKDELQPNFGIVNVHFGNIDMDPKHLEENFICTLKEVNEARPKRAGTFVTRCYISSPPSTEKIRLDPFVYIEREKASTKAAVVKEPYEIDQESDSDSDDEAEKKSNASAA